MMKTVIFRISILTTLLVLSNVSIAGVTTIEKLNFGTLAIVDNTVQSDISISSATNQISITNGFRVLVPGNRAEFLLTSNPNYTPVYTTATVLVAETTSLTPPSEQFTLINVESTPSATTDGTGLATIYVGGTLRSSGSGTGQYFDATYTATYKLDINF